MWRGRGPRDVARRPRRPSSCRRQRRAEQRRTIQTALVPKHCTTEERGAALRALQLAAPGVKLTAPKLLALAAFIAGLPSILKTAATPATIKTGFLRSGMIDRASDTRPSLRAIMGTCRGGFTKVSYCCCCCSC